MAIQGGRPDNRQIVPYLIVGDSRAAVAFYQRAFGAQLVYSDEMPGGRGIFAQLKLGDSYIQLVEDASAQPGSKFRSPLHLGGTSVVLERYVDDVDAAYKHALEAGATSVFEPADMFFGDRYAWVTDPWGHIWAIATAKERLSPEELRRRMMEFMAQAGAH
jgi:PhnB protein